MSEQKVWVEKMPESVTRRAICLEDRTLIGVELIFADGTEPEEIEDIHDRDRELVKEVCEKIRKFCENNKYRCNKYFSLYSIGLNVKLLNKNKEGQKETFYEFLDQLQKEYEK